MWVQPRKIRWGYCSYRGHMLCVEGLGSWRTSCRRECAELQKMNRNLLEKQGGQGEFFPDKTTNSVTCYSIQQSPLLWVSDLYLPNITGYCSQLEISCKSFFMFLLFYFWPHLEACRILAPRLGFEPMPSIMKAWHPTHWNSQGNLKAIRSKASVFFFFLSLKQFRIKTTIWPSDPTPRHIPGGNQNWKRQKKKKKTYVPHCSLQHYLQ